MSLHSLCYTLINQKPKPRLKFPPLGWERNFSHSETTILPPLQISINQWMIIPVTDRSEPVSSDDLSAQTTATSPPAGTRILYGSVDSMSNVDYKYAFDLSIMVSTLHQFGRLMCRAFSTLPEVQQARLTQDALKNQLYLPLRPLSEIRKSQSALKHHRLRYMYNIFNGIQLKFTAFEYDDSVGTYDPVPVIAYKPPVCALVEGVQSPEAPPCNPELEGSVSASALTLRVFEW